MVDTTKELCVELDASDFATGAVLSMKCDDGKWHPCAYLSKGLNDVERNYDVHDKEMLGIMHALESWRHYLEGARCSLRSGLIIVTCSILWKPRSLTDDKHAGHFIYQDSISIWYINQDQLWEKPTPCRGMRIIKRG